jgi:hypothetical protein
VPRDSATPIRVPVAKWPTTITKTYGERRVSFGNMPLIGILFD